MILFGKLLCYLFLEEKILYGKIVSEYMFMYFLIPFIIILLKWVFMSQIIIYITIQKSGVL